MKEIRSEGRRRRLPSATWTTLPILRILYLDYPPSGTRVTRCQRVPVMSRSTPTRSRSSICLSRGPPQRLVPQRFRRPAPPLRVLASTLRPPSLLATPGIYVWRRGGRATRGSLILHAPPRRSALTLPQTSDFPPRCSTRRLAPPRPRRLALVRDLHDCSPDRSRGVH